MSSVSFVVFSAILSRNEIDLLYKRITFLFCLCKVYTRFDSDFLYFNFITSSSYRSVFGP